MMKNYYLVIQGIKILPISILLVFMLFAPSNSYGQRDSVFINLNIASNSLFLIDKDRYECHEYDGRYLTECLESLKERINSDKDDFSELEKSILHAKNNLKNMDCPLAKQKVDDASKNVSLAKEKFQLVLINIISLEENVYLLWYEREPYLVRIRENYSAGMWLLDSIKKDLNYAWNELNKCDSK